MGRERGTPIELAWELASMQARPLEPQSRNHQRPKKRSQRVVHGEVAWHLGWGICQWLIGPRCTLALRRLHGKPLLSLHPA